MSTSTLQQLPKATAAISINIPWEDIKQTYQDVFNGVVKEAELPGFRKGKAPREMIEKSIDKSKLYQEVIKQVIPKAFAEAVKKHNLSPITSPKIEVKQAKEGEEWVVEATVALKPDVKLGNYKQKIRELKKPKAEIWTPGKEPKKENKEEEKIKLDTIMKTLLENTQAELSDILISEEVNRMLADLIDQTKKLGLTVEQYLIAKGKTTEQIQAEFKSQAESTLTLQFAINEIADTEKITVNQADLDKVLATIEKPEDRERLKKDSYYLAHLIRQQKTLEFLQNL